MSKSSSYKQLKTTFTKYREKEMIITTGCNMHDISISHVTLPESRKEYMGISNNSFNSLKSALVDTKLFLEEKELDDFIQKQVEPNLISILLETSEEPKQNSYSGAFKLEI